MAIKDFDGTAYHEIGKIADWDGTTHHQIGKVYDWNGAAHSLIYSSEQEILTLFSSSDYYNLNAAYQAASVNTDGSLQFNSTSFICRNIWTPEIDLSQWNTMSIIYTVTKSSVPAGYNNNRKFYVFANSTNTFEGDFSNRTDMNSSNIRNPKTTHYKMYLSGNADYYGQSYYVEPNLDAGKTYTQTIDISDWIGVLKIGLASLCGDSNTLTMQVTSVKLN